MNFFNHFHAPPFPPPQPPPSQSLAPSAFEPVIPDSNRRRSFQDVYPLRLNNDHCDNENGRKSCPEIIEDIGITYEALITIKIKHLNNLLKGMSKERKNEIKSIRRTLKNRGYAANCRIKQLSEKEQIEVSLREMTQEVERNKKELAYNRYKTAELIQSCDNLLRSLDQYESGEELKEKIKEKVLNENPPLEERMKDIFKILGGTTRTFKYNG